MYQKYHCHGSGCILGWRLCHRLKVKQKSSLHCRLDNDDGKMSCCYAIISNISKWRWTCCHCDMSFSSLSHSKMFDIELCPLPFSMEEMFGFISCRFSGYPASVQEQALLWLHVSSHTRKCTHTDSFSCDQLVSCGSIHGECEVNRLSQSVWVWAGARAEHGSGSQRLTVREREIGGFSLSTHMQSQLAVPYSWINFKFSNTTTIQWWQVEQSGEVKTSLPQHFRNHCCLTVFPSDWLCEMKPHTTTW